MALWVPEAEELPTKGYFTSERWLTPHEIDSLLEGTSVPSARESDRRLADARPGLHADEDSLGAVRGMLTSMVLAVPAWLITAALVWLLA
ncbi:MAG: hypothetical protein ACR2I8_07560 [Steroidobacteraceae bacterium]